MRIGTREIGPAHPPYIIAELGVNHDGSVDRALQLVDAAAGAGADAVKLQLFTADLLMSRAARLAAYQKAAGESDPVEMLRRLELSTDQMAPVVDRAHARGIHAIVTVFSVELVGAAERLPWDAYKTASPDIIHRPLLESLTATGKPLIVSTGASTMEEVTQAVNWLRPALDRLALLQCVSCYPTPADQAHIGAMNDLLHLTSTVGYSDHTREIETGEIAVRCGAVMLEKHFTHDRAADGPDHAASLEAKEFREYAQRARARAADRRPSSIGDSSKVVLPIERDVRAVSRQSITTVRDLAAGHRLTRADLTFKRPGTGLAPFYLDEVLNRSLARPVEADLPLTDADLAPT
ncbi:MAG: N-acetylneuraminate synthase family protein [Phycisphaerales bacterium]